jgi:hypothetical protein
LEVVRIFIVAKMSGKDDKTPCRDCGKPVTEANAAVGCDGSRGRWYHKECSGVSAGDFATLKKPSCSLLWMCKECKVDLTMIKTGKEELKGIWTEITKLKEIIKVTVAEERRKALTRSDIEQRPEGKKSRPTVITTKVEGKNSLTKVTAPKTPRRETDIRGDQEKVTQRIRQHTDNIQAIAKGVNHDIPTRDDGVDSAKPPDNIGHRWNEVVRRGHRHRAEIRGSRQAEDTNLKAAEKTAWLYVGKLHQTTEKEDLVKFLRDNEITGDIACDQLDTKGINKAFRVGIAYDHLAQVNCSEFVMWEGLSDHTPA